MSLCPPERRNGESSSRLFVKLGGCISQGGLKWSKQVIGKNMLASFPYSVAIAIGIPEEEARRFTGHSYRRTALTWAADQGLTVQQMKNISGHQSDTVVQRKFVSQDCRHITSDCLLVLCSTNDCY